MSKLHLVPSIFITDGRARIVNPISNDTNLADAVDLAVELEEIGFEEIVLVDVDGAKSGAFHTFDILNEISSLTQFDILVGGGIRDEITVEKVFNAGASRVLLNTIPASDREMMLRLVDAYGNNSFVIGLDLIEKGIVIKGRSESVDVSIEEMIGFYLEVGIDRYILQTLNKDGNKISPDPEFYQTIKSVFFHARIYAGEGLNNDLQFEQFEDSGIEGLILGDDFYTNEQIFIGLKKYMFE